MPQLLTLKEIVAAIQYHTIMYGKLQQLKKKSEEEGRNRVLILWTHLIVSMIYGDKEANV